MTTRSGATYKPTVEGGREKGAAGEGAARTAEATSAPLTDRVNRTIRVVHLAPQVAGHAQQAHAALQQETTRR